MLPLSLSRFLTFFSLIGTITLSVHTNTHTETDTDTTSDTLAVRHTVVVTLLYRNWQHAVMNLCEREREKESNSAAPTLRH